MKLRLAMKKSDVAGQSAVELALVLPLLVLLALGIFDFSRAIRASNIITNISREGANLAARSTIAPQDVMKSLASTAQPLAMDTDGAMYLTQVIGVSGVPTVQPQSVWGNTANGRDSRINQANVAAKLGAITIPNGDSVYIFEVLYTYNSLFMQSYSPTLYSVTIF
jgi:Flp pilus assembly protein TadG